MINTKIRLIIFADVGIAITSTPAITPKVARKDMAPCRNFLLGISAARSATYIGIEQNWNGKAYH